MTPDKTIIYVTCLRCDAERAQLNVQKDTYYCRSCGFSLPAEEWNKFNAWRGVYLAVQVIGSNKPFQLRWDGKTWTLDGEDIDDYEYSISGTAYSVDRVVLDAALQIAQS